MATTYTFTTAKGSLVEIVFGDTGAVSANVNGKPHSAVAELVVHPERGLALKLAGNVFAPIADIDAEPIKALFAAAADANAAWLAEEGRKYAASDAAFADRMCARMYARNSRY